MPPIKIKELENKFQEIPNKPGVYWYEINEPIEEALFKKTNPAGHFRGQNPTVTISVLKKKWLPEATILYIGRSNNLSERIKLRSRFAKGEPVRAWGGRYLWQLDDSIQKRITVRYKVVEDSKTAERLEILNFKRKYGKLPFANLITPRRRLNLMANHILWKLKN